MPIEIRELIIKTEIESGRPQHGSATSPAELKAFKRQVLEECRKLLTQANKRKSYKR